MACNHKLLRDVRAYNGVDIIYTGADDTFVPSIPNAQAIDDYAHSDYNRGWHRRPQPWAHSGGNADDPATPADTAAQNPNMYPQASSSSSGTTRDPCGAQGPITSDARDTSQSDNIAGDSWCRRA